MRSNNYKRDTQKLSGYDASIIRGETTRDKLHYRQGNGSGNETWDPFPGRGTRYDLVSGRESVSYEYFNIGAHTSILERRRLR